MNRERTIEHIRIALSSVLNKEITDLGEDARLVADLNLDSTSVIELLMALEGSIGIELDLDELEPEVFTTVATLADFVEKESLDVLS